MKKLLIILFAFMLLTACSSEETKNEIFSENLYINGKSEEVEVLRNTERYNVEYRDRLFVLSESQFEELKNKDNKLLLTYDNKIRENFDESNIEKYMELSSFYQVLLKNGETLQMFDKPNVDFDPEVLPNSENIEGVYKHGDHYHIKLKNGTEYISHDDPTALVEDLELEEYEGEHGDVDIHEEHSDSDDHDHEEDNHSDADTDHHEDDGHDHSSETLSFIPVVTLESLKDKDIVEIKLHGDHWHLEDKEGNEYLTYDDPRELFPEIEAIEY